MFKHLVLFSTLTFTATAFAASLDMPLEGMKRERYDLIESQVEIKERIAKRLKKDVFIKPLAGTSLYVVIVNENVLFTDSDGSVLINGDILSLEDSILISKVEKEEFAALRRKAKIVEESKVEDVSHFLSASDGVAVNRKMQPLSESVAASTNQQQREETTHSLNKPEASVLGYTPEKLDFEQKCLAKIKDKKDLKEITNAFQSDMSGSERVECGQVFARAVVNNLPESEFIHYKASEPRASVTIFSDYTCGFCIREHREIDTLLKQGISVKVYPYIRNYFRERVQDTDGKVIFGNFTTQGKNLATVQCSTDDNEERKRLFDMLMDNPANYEKQLLEETAKVDFNGKCVESSHRQKLFGDLFTSRGTPLHVFSNGSTYRGYLTPSQIVDKAI
ncbi:thioredoxin fold domain-containing protein [Vibrio harveyi]|uniref:thioredoxin fold domain-containing protein n=1 Tax=Vibrio harveyi TaxID=669 RepID=UPI0024816FE0|nr:thioredoxin fold domain-containing protein [Vibrio harveyi]